MGSHSIFTHGGWDYYALAIFFFGIPVALDALLRWPITYRRAGLKKWHWALAALVTFLFLVGPFFAVIYLATAQRKMRAAKPRRPKRTPSRSTGGYGGDSGGTPPYRSSGWPNDQRTLCTRCSGGRQVSCTCLNGQVENPNSGPSMVPHFTCRGTGRIDCPSCGGTGYQR